MGIALVLVAVTAAQAEEAAPLVVREHAGVSRRAAPVTGGVPVVGKPKPAATGTRQSMIVEGAPAGARYVRIRTWDDFSNQSLLSNEVRAEVR